MPAPVSRRCKCSGHKEEPMPKGVVNFCDMCDPCNECVSTVKLCAFVVPTLEDGRYYKNSFIFVQEDDSTYYISDDRSEIPFGSRPKFENNFNPEDSKYKNTTVYDIERRMAYVFDKDSNYLIIPLETPTPDPRAVLSDSVNTIVSLTQEEYDQLEEKDPKTLYLVGE